MAFSSLRMRLSTLGPNASAVPTTRYETQVSYGHVTIGCWGSKFPGMNVPEVNCSCSSMAPAVGSMNAEGGGNTAMAVAALGTGVPFVCTECSPFHDVGHGLGDRFFLAEHWMLWSTH